MTRLVFLIVLACAVFAPWTRAAAGTTAAPTDTPGVVTLHDAQFAITGDTLPPATGWQPITLPDSWQVRRPDLSGYAWYRIRFSLDTVPTQPLALYVPRVSLVATFWLNGSLLNPGAVFDQPHGRMGSPMNEAPLYLVLPSGLFHPGDNELDIRLQGDRRIHSGLSAPVLGPATELESRWAVRHALQVTIPNVILVLVLGALVFAVAHLQRQRRTHLIQLGLLSGIGAGISYLAIAFPMGREAALLARVVTYLVMHWTLVVIGYRMAGTHVKGLLPVWHTVTALTGVAVLWCAVTGNVTDRIWMWTWPHVLLQFVIVYLLLQTAWRERSIKLAALAITGAFWLVTIAQSYLLLMDVLPWDQFRWSNAGVAPFCVVQFFVFAEQFILDRHQAALAQQHAISAERGRILQDMHDGMGAHLIAALHLARRGNDARHQLIDSIEASLHDLRSMIDSLDLAGEDLLPLLANLRFRIEPRLNALGIRLAWDVATPFPEIRGLTPQAALSVLRIVQESINNTVQHAGARSLRFTAHAAAGDLCIHISDDGHGFDARVARPGGHGLAGMHTRARSLGGSVRIDSGQDGTTVELRIPLVQTSRVPATRADRLSL